ncbi:hypothetical protein C8R44DRAFT_778892, partial [Mycena epipterygia]
MICSLRSSSSVEISLLFSVTSQAAQGTRKEDGWGAGRKQRMRRLKRNEERHGKTTRAQDERMKTEDARNPSRKGIH